MQKLQERFNVSVGCISTVFHDKEEDVAVEMPGNLSCLKKKGTRM